MKKLCLANLLLLAVLAVVCVTSFVWANALINPGFEDGDATGWSGGVDEAHGGYWVWDHDQRSGNYTAAAGSWSSDPTLIILSQEVAVEEGDQIVFSGWTSGQDDFTPDSEACLKIEFLDTYGNVILSRESRSRSGTYEYVKDSVEAAAPEEANIARCIFYVVSTGGSAVFDDAEIIIK